MRFSLFMTYYKGHLKRIITIPLWVLFMVLIPYLEVEAMGAVREPCVAGRFYPNDPQELREMIQGFLGKADDIPLQGSVFALLAPHAGYMYSGQVAAQAYRTVKGQSFDTVVVLAPSHRIPFHGASVLTQGAYRTPLGLVPLDENKCQRLCEAHARIQEIPDTHGPEHSLEVQLPFLQIVIQDGWKLVPLIMGDQDIETAGVIAGALREVLEGCRALIVASSDLSHFHHAEQAEQMDQAALRFMESMDPEGLWSAIRDGKVEACGVGPVLVAMIMARQAGIQKGSLLKYAHSGDITGDRTRVVGYAALIWTTQEAEKAKSRPPVGVDLGLTNEEKRTLKEIARTTIQCRLQGTSPPQTYEGITALLREPRGAFVTLERHGQLRGCIGLIEAIKPLYQTIQEMAEAAAFRDPRFPALRLEEWPDVEIEISVLTPLREIQDVSEIQVGINGICIVKGPYRGLLLPQVATDHHWDRTTFLSHTCMKAGLPKDAWKDPGVKIYIFSSDIF